MRRKQNHLILGALVVCLTHLSGCRNRTATIDDATVNAALQTRLQSDPGLSGQAIQASAIGGIVTLSGTVNSQAARSLAANDAAEVNGVRTVENNLFVSVPSAPAVATTASPKEEAAKPADGVKRVKPLKQAAGPLATYRPPVQSPSPIERRDPPRSPAVPAPIAPSASPVLRNVTVPVGTGLSVRITQTLDSETTQPGTSFSGVLASDVVVDGLVAFPAGTRVNGHVDDVKDAGHFSGSSLLAVSLTGIVRRGDEMTISTDTYSKEGKGRGKNTAVKVGGGAALGAILGGIFGGGKGAAIGAAAGGGAGTVANGVTRGEQVQITSESLLRFRLTSPITVKSSTPSDDNRGGELRRHDQ